MLKKIGLIAMIALMVSGCQPGMSAQSQQVRLSPNPPASNCSFVGEVTGKQDFYSEQAGMDKLRDQAASLGANYVQLRGHPDGFIEGANNTQIPKVVYSGKAYKCP